MQPIFLSHHAARRNLVPLSPGVTPATVSEVYDAVRYKSGETTIRAGQDPVDSWYVYAPKKEGKLAAATYKAASIKRHRQAMSDLLTEISNALTGELWSAGPQKKTIIELRTLALKKDVATEDFKARELSSALKPLSDHLRVRQRLIKTSAIKAATSPLLKSRLDYLNQFLRMSESDLRIMQQALFSNDDVCSFQEKKLILKSIFTLIKTYVNQKEGKKMLEELIRQSPQQDLLLKFARAWLDHVDKRRFSNRANLLVVFSWQKTMTAVCEKILAAQPAQAPATPVVASPERSMVLKKMIYRSGYSMDGTEPDTPTKFPTLVTLASDKDLPEPSPTPSRTATPVSLRTVGKSGTAAPHVADEETVAELALYSSPGPAQYPVSEADFTEIEGAYEISIDRDAISRRTDSNA